MGTKTNSSSSDSLSSTSDYSALLSEIQSTIDKNDALFKQIQQSNYPNAGSYTSDLLNYKIDTSVSDLTAARQQIWDFLTKKYEENTKLRTYYFNEIRKIDEHLTELNTQQQDIIDSIQAKNIETNTSSEKIKNEKYNYNKMQYYLFLYKVLVAVQIIILILIVLSIFNLIPRSTCLVIVVIILIATIAFVGYYVFFVNIGRNRFSWNKFEHDNSTPAVQKCQTDNVVSDEDKKKAAADEAVSALISSSGGNNKSCAAS
jgi:hypothetical protein